MTTRQELYDRIRQSSKDEVILEEMIRLGFWPSNEDMPSSPAGEIKRKGELERELRALTVENQRLTNVEAIKRDQRKKRLEDSKRRRKENKERKLRERAERAAAWNDVKATQLSYLGQGASGGLSNKESDKGKLQHNNLPPMENARQLAASMRISIGLLRFLAFGRRTSRVNHYRRFDIRKKTGGVRRISAPMPRLKAAQRWILDNILLPVKLNDAAHGFRHQRSIVTNAQAHVGANVVINMDVEDFFPTVTYRRIKGVFRSLGYSETLATCFAMLCSEPDISEVEIDQGQYYVARGERFLPQGAPTSPAITNLICRGMDARLNKIADQLGFQYTRYADDITFSSKDSTADVGRAIRRIKHVVSDEGFNIHPDKTRVLRSGRRMEVTGLTVSEKVSIPRKQLRNFRATLFQIEKDGTKGKTWGNSNDVIASICGYANFVAMVNPELGSKFRDQISRIIEKHGREHLQYVQRQRWKEPDNRPPVIQSTIPVATTVYPPKEAKPKEKPAKKPWWKFW